MAVDLLGEFQRGIVAHTALAIVHSRDFQNHCQVTAGGDGNGDHRHLHIQDLGVVILQAQPIINFMGIPGNDLNNEIDLVILLDSTDAEKLGNIDDADAAEFDVIADQFRRGTRRKLAETFLISTASSAMRR